MDSFAQKRRGLVEHQIKRRGISDPAVLAAVESVPREAFLPPELAEFAYLDRALPIEKGQTISQPYIVALMTEALQLKPQDRVLEVGTGSGYAAAILAKVAREVYTIERHAELAEQAARRLREQGYDNVHILHGDGTLGWPEHAPYDAIVVAAGGPEVPRPLLISPMVEGAGVQPGFSKVLYQVIQSISDPYLTASALLALIHSTSSLNEPAFLSDSRKPKEVISLGFNGLAFGTILPNDVATNLSKGIRTSIHSPAVVLNDAR